MSGLRQTSKRSACWRRGETQQGLALVALTAVLALFGSLKIATDAVQRSAADDREDRAVTAERLAAAERALVRYATRNGELPCPANGTAGLRASPGSTARTENPSSDVCTIDADKAVLPWADLGIQAKRALDGWGRRISYFMDRNNPIEVDRDGATATNVAFVLISHGDNGLGAFTGSGGQVPGYASSSTEERENVDGDGGTPATFHAIPYRKGPSVADSNVFDDLVRFVTDDEFNRRSGLASASGGSDGGSDGDESDDDDDNDDDEEDD